MHIEWDENVEILIYDKIVLLEKIISKSLAESGKTKIRVTAYVDQLTSIEMSIEDLDTSETLVLYINLDKRTVTSFGLDTAQMKTDDEVQLSID